jgi:hypothetical protein
VRGGCENNAPNLANQHLAQLKSERSLVLLGMIDRERERQAYNDILAWCQKVKESRDELTYPQKRDFLHMMGIVVVAKRGLDGQLDLSMEIELPEIKDLISSSVDFVERSSVKSFGRERTAWAAGSSCWSA